MGGVSKLHGQKSRWNGDIVNTLYTYFILLWFMESNELVGCKTITMSMSEMEYWM